MPVINYIREHTRFIEYASDEHLSASERLVWYALMHIMNQHAQGNVWPGEFIRIANDRLLTYCPMKFDTMAAARNSLKQRGLIEVIPGEKNRKAPAYRMNYFCPVYIPASEDDCDGTDVPPQHAGGYPKKSDYMGDYMGGNMGDNIGGNMGDYMGDININYIRVKDKRNPTETLMDDDEEDININKYARAREAKYPWSPEYNSIRRGTSTERDAIARKWEDAFGEKPTPQTVNELAEKIRGAVTLLDVLKAIRNAAVIPADNPFRYVMECLFQIQQKALDEELRQEREEPTP